MRRGAAPAPTLRASPRLLQRRHGEERRREGVPITDFDFAELLAEAEAHLDDQGVPDHFGTELTLAEGESWSGRYRGEDEDRAFDPPRGVYLLAEPDGTPYFLRRRAMLERQMRDAEPAVGDYLAVVRGADSVTKAGNTLQTWGVSSRPCPDPLPEVAKAAEPEAEAGEGAEAEDGGEVAVPSDIPF
jgi:hypothetical protein